MEAKVILNPYANRWQALKRKGDVETALKAACIDFDMVVTEYPRHATELAANAVTQGYSPIIAAGGDGTINEVINGIAIAAKSINKGTFATLGVIPLGTVNDLIVNLKMPVDLEKAMKIISEGFTRNIDLGIVQGKYFHNNSAMGLEPTITLIQERIAYLHGAFRYLVSALMGIAQNPNWVVNLEWDGGNYCGPVTLVTVGNNPLTGGLFYMAPHADPFDGKLTFVYGYLSTPLKLLKLLPRTMKPGPGSFIEHPDIHEIHTTWIKIQTETPTPLHTDGEIYSTNIKEINYQISPKILPLLMPR